MKGDVAENVVFTNFVQKGNLTPMNRTNRTDKDSPEAKKAEFEALYLKRSSCLQAADISVLQVSDLADFKETPGLVLLFLGDDLARSRETIDLLVIAPELRALFEAEPITSGAVLPRDIEGAQTLRGEMLHWGIKRLPAVALLMDGRFLGAMEGLFDWLSYQEGLVKLLLQCQQKFEIQNEDINKKGGKLRYRTISIVPVTRMTQDA